MVVQQNIERRKRGHNISAASHPHFRTFSLADITKLEEMEGESYDASMLIGGNIHDKQMLFVLPVLEEENVVCEMRFAEESSINQQKLTDYGLKRFSCGQCEKRFAHNSNLNRHMLTHDGVQPFPCDQCDKRFADKSNLNRHKLIHDGLKHFFCDQCKKGFVRRGHLNRHMLTHV